MSENKVRVVFEAFMDKFKRDVKDAAKATLEIGDAGAYASKKVNFDEANDSVNLLEKNLNRITGTLKAMAVGYIGKKLFGAGKENLEFFMEFQDGMKAVHTLLPHLTEEGLGEMSKQAKQFSKDMKVLPEDITPAIYNAISAGVPDVEAFDFLEDAQIAAKAGRTDFATSVNFLTNVINSYGAETITATEASDAMFIAMRNGKISFDEMAAHMYSIVPDAAEIGLEFNNIAAAAGRMGAMGTPIAQGTTQLGAFIRELKNAESKAGDIFYQATRKTLRQFIAEGNNIQDIIMIMDAAAKQLNVEVSQLFGSKEASNVVTSLAKVKDTFANDLNEIQNSSGSTEAAYEKMGSTLSTVFDSIKSRIAVFKLDIADKYFPEVQDAAEKLDESLERLDQDGTLNNLAGSIGNLVTTIVNQFDNIINNIDGVIEKIDNLASFIDTSLPGAIEVVKALAWAFLAVKTGMLIKDGISLFQGGIKILTPIIAGLTKGLWGATTAQTTLNTTMALNPIGAIIIAISLLIMAIINLSDEYMSFSDFLLVSFELIKIAFYSLLWVLVKGFDIIIWGLDKLIGWIPGIGEALEKVANVSGKALDTLSSSIDDSIRKIDELNNKEIKDKIPKPGTPGGGMTPEQEDLALAQYATKVGKETTEDTEDPYKPAPTIYDISTDKGKKKKEKTIHDRIREVKDKTNPDIDLYESRSDLAKIKEDDKGVKQNKNLIIETLRKQAGDMLNLQLSSKGQDVKIVEAARNKLLVKIEETLKDINDGVSKMVGDFNTPSDLRVLTEYQYKVDKSDNNLSKRFVYSPKVSMFLTIPDTGEKGIAQTKAEIEHFTGAIFADDKNDLVTKFMQDVTRN